MAYLLLRLPRGCKRFQRVLIQKVDKTLLELPIYLAEAAFSEKFLLQKASNMHACPEAKHPSWYLKQGTILKSILLRIVNQRVLSWLSCRHCIILYKCITRWMAGWQEC
jgi:hypothetical protein